MRDARRDARDSRLQLSSRLLSFFLPSACVPSSAIQGGVLIIGYELMRKLFGGDKKVGPVFVVRACVCVCVLGGKSRCVGRVGRVLLRRRPWSAALQSVSNRILPFFVFSGVAQRG